MKKRSTKAHKMPSADQIQTAEIKRNGQTRPNGGYAEQIRGTSRKQPGQE
ncbi:MAG: hypothetical protein ACR2RF_32230 [Geminicoccaceae bacterium]